MKKHILLTAFILISGTISSAQFPQIITYMGSLTDSSGVAVKDDIYKLKFKIYDDSTGTSALWESGDSISVQITDGNFIYDLGSNIGLPDSLSKYPRLWLGIIVEMPNATEKIVSLSYDNPYSEEPASEYEEKDSLVNVKSDELALLDPKYIRSPKVDPPSSGDSHPTAKEPAIHVFLKSSLDLNGRYKVKYIDESAKTDVKTGISAALEFQEILNGGALIRGAGIEYMLGRSQRDYEGDFSFISVYFLMKFTIFSRELTSDLPFFTGKLGYNYLTGDENFKGTEPYEAKLKGGLTFGVGFGYNFDNKVICEAIYQVNNGEASLGNADFNIKYTRFSLSVGVYLNPGRR
jgi:hypothetical protein